DVLSLVSPAENLALTVGARRNASSDEVAHANAVKTRLSSEATPVVALIAGTERRLLTLGVNPGGPGIDVREASDGMPWTELFDWDNDPPTERPTRDLSLAGATLLIGIRSS